MKFLELHAAQKARGVVRLPGSKSISNRILLLSALANGTTNVRDVLISDDTKYMLKALRLLGVSIDQTTENDCVVHGVSGQFPVREAELFLGNAGTVYRPLTAALSLMQQGHYWLYGVPRMYQRPIRDLVDVLRQLGSNITYLRDEGFPPLEIKAAKIKINSLSVKGDVSSQYLTSLLIALPLIGKALNIEVIGKLISQPYVNLTLALMLRFGIEIKQDEKQYFIQGEQNYISPGEIFVEGDASSASYFLAAGAIGGGPVRVEGVGCDSLQGDIHFIEVLKKMGACVSYGNNWIEVRAPQDGRLQAINIDCNHFPDAAMTLAVVALFADGVTVLTNIASWKIKETDRLSAMATELSKLGADVYEGVDTLQITPPIDKKINSNISINTYDDHRIAMCFSLVSLKVPVRINNPNCVSKTFPDYFEKFAKIIKY